MKMKNQMNCTLFSIFFFLLLFFLKMKNEWKALKTQRKNLLNMKIVVNYLNFVFHIEVSVENKI